MKQTMFPPYKVVSVDSLVPYVNNSRTHTDSQVAQVAASIKEFGFTSPVLVDGENGIVAGHCRVLAAQKLGMTEVPVIELGHLSDHQRRAYVIADNKLALNAGWDTDMLALELTDLGELGFNVELTGFTADDLAGFTFKPDFGPGSEGEQGRLDQKVLAECPECGHRFDP